MGGLLKKKSEKIAEKNPEWYINKNSEYAKYVSSGHDYLEGNDENLGMLKK